MNHEAVQPLIPSYAIGAVDAEERAQVEAHLRTCPACRSLLADYQMLSDDFLYTVPLVEAPAHLSLDLQRRLGRAAATPRGRPAYRLASVRRFSLAALAVALVLLLATNAYWFARVRRVEQEAALQAMAIQTLAEAPTAILVGDAAAPDAHGVLYFRPESTVAILHVYNLPPLPEDKTYQLWLIRNGQRDNGGLFRLNEQGEATLLVISPRPFADYDAVGVTAEPMGGSPGPTSPRVIGGTF